jgi:hypothetical protein
MFVNVIYSLYHSYIFILVCINVYLILVVSYGQVDKSRLMDQIM